VKEKKKQCGRAEKTDERQAARSTLSVEKIPGDVAAASVDISGISTPLWRRKGLSGLGVRHEANRFAGERRNALASSINDAAAHQRQK
jgi:hypothetical protein